MGQSVEITVPDIGDFEEVEVVELLVAKGDEVAFDDPLVSVESDKATMEIPSTAAGVVLELRVAEGDKVSEGSVLVVLEVAESADSPSPKDEDEGDSEPGEAAEAESETAAAEGAAPDSTGPSDQADEGSGAEGATESTSPSTSASASPSASRSSSTSAASPSTSAGATPPVREMSRAAAHPVPDRTGGVHASPLVRRYARELGVPVESATGTGPHGRLLFEDLTETVRARFAGDSTAGSAGGASLAGAGIPAVPAVDHSAFGPIREESLTRIQKVSGPVLHRSWLNVPHVTQYDESDVTELERFRRDRRELAAERGVKLSPLLFVMKAVVRVLEEFPAFRSSLAPEADRLIVKEYFHLGIAVDTDQGLVVPVIRDVDRKGVFELAAEVNETAERARARKLTPDDLKGACFTISSLGGIGGVGFSPIVNAPEVAILGLSKTRTQPVWRGPSPLDEPQALVPPQALNRPQALDMPRALDGPQARESGQAEESAAGYFEPRLVMPFSLSYDHRVIDGANAVRFTTRLAGVLSDPMQLLL